MPTPTYIENVKNTKLYSHQITSGNKIMVNMI